MDKQELRAFYLNKRDRMDEIYRKLASLDISRQLFEEPDYKEADTILCFVGFRSEVDTKGIIADALKQGKKVYCPKVLSKHHMEFYQIFDEADLSPGKYGILEPTPETFDSCWKENDSMKTCIIVPGAVFDVKGNRIGYGGGYYDYYLSRHSLSCKIGLGFDGQITDEIEVEETDQRLDILISEKEVYRFV